MSKKKKFKQKLDPFTSANEIEHQIVDKKKRKRTITEKKRHQRHQEKEIVKQLTSDLAKLSKQELLEDPSRDYSDKKKQNEVIYTIWPVKIKKI